MNELHPLSMFVLTMNVLFSAAFLNDPVIMVIFLVASVITALLANVKHIWCCGFIILASALINPFFNHRGETILFFVNDRPITMETFFYGINTGVLLCSAVLLMGAYSKIMTTDKHLYLFGKLNAQLGMLVCFAIRFVPLFIKKYNDISDSGKAMGLYSGEAITDHIKNKLSAFGATMTWALENGVITAQSMEARGYGLVGRSSYSLYRIKARDACLIAVSAVCVAILILTAGEVEFYYYPHLAALSTAKLPRMAFAVMSFCLAAVEIKERLFWKYSASKTSPFPTMKVTEIFSKI